MLLWKVDVRRATRVFAILCLWAISPSGEALAESVTLQLEFTSTNGLPVMGRELPVGSSFNATVEFEADLEVNGLQELGTSPTLELTVDGYLYQGAPGGNVFVNVLYGEVLGIQISTGALDFGNGSSGGLSTTLAGTWGVLRLSEPFNINEGRGTYQVASQMPEPTPPDPPTSLLYDISDWESGALLGQIEFSVAHSLDGGVPPRNLDELMHLDFVAFGQEWTTDDEFYGVLSWTVSASTGELEALSLGVENAEGEFLELFEDEAICSGEICGPDPLDTRSRLSVLITAVPEPSGDLQTVVALVAVALVRLRFQARKSAGLQA